MGLMDRLKNNRRGAEGASERVPTNFDELQAAVDADEVTAAIGIDSRHGDVGGTRSDAPSAPRRLFLSLSIKPISSPRLSCRRLTSRTRRPYLA